MESIADISLSVDDSGSTVCTEKADSRQRNRVAVLEYLRGEQQRRCQHCPQVGSCDFQLLPLPVLACIVLHLGGADDDNVLEIVRPVGGG